MTNEINNPELELAWDFVEKTDRSIFLTGKAGTGKTTFLHKIKAESLKRMIVVAPTGVAAINAKGVTIHSFFQLPFGPIIPDGSQFQQRGNYKMRFGRQKIDIIKTLDLLVIDEISMVRADLLDGIDQVLRRYKDPNKVFGGVQVLMIGDLQQLAPVVKPNEWSMLEPYYETAFFFSSQSFQQANTIGIELQHIYRQDNQQFITILNEIRNNQLSQESANQLNKRFHPGFQATKDEGYITLTTHNNRAAKMNNEQLRNINKQSYFCEAEIKGTFNEQAFPTLTRLELKQGAQVMFIKNDPSPEKRYFNGKIGTIMHLDNEGVAVKCPGEEALIIATRETWENVKYTINPDNKEITEDFVGSFTQMPLRLAWAITIHKSQGLTFDKAIIDAEASFTHGQTYVALSRCRSLEGLVLKSRISDSSIITDPQVLTYTRQVQENPPTNNDFTESQARFQLNLMADLYDYSAFVYPLKRCLGIYYKNKNSIKGNTLDPLNTMLDNGVNRLIGISMSFGKQVQSLVKDIQLPENSDLIQGRLKKATAYFIEQTELFIKKPLSDFSFNTDNKETIKNINKQLKIIEELLEYKLTCLNDMKDGFNSQLYLQSKSKALLYNSQPSKTKKEYIDTTEHPELFEQLKEFRLGISRAEEIAAFQIFTQQTLYEMCNSFPTTLPQLKSIHGMGKVRVEKYGEDIVEIISKYAKQHKLSPKPTKQKNKKAKIKKGATQQESLTLFKKGLTVVEIAEQRGLVESTIEGHLSNFIVSGEIAIQELMALDKYHKIKSATEKIKFEGLSDLKTKLDDVYSFAELRMSLMAIEYSEKDEECCQQ